MPLHRIGIVLTLTLAVIMSPAPARADLDDICLRCYNLINWIFRPAPQEDILKYRRSWNPFAAGPMLNPAIDIQPKGQSVIHPFWFGETGHEQFRNTLRTSNLLGGRARDAATHLSAVLLLVPWEYGVTDSLEFVFAPTFIFWDATQLDFNPNKKRNNIGVGDTSIFLKHRPIVQDPDGWRPTVTFFHGLTLPTSQALNTMPVPGGFAPVGRLPATRFGDLSFTEGIMFRKNIRPFRLMGAVYYSYATAGSTGSQLKYTGDIVNWRLIGEHILDDDRGLGYLIEFNGIHGLPFRLDGHSVNVPAVPPVKGYTLPTTPVFSVIGVEPTLEYKFSNNIVMAGGVLFTIAGQNNFDAIYPNFVIYYYWGSKGKPVIMR